MFAFAAMLLVAVPMWAQGTTAVAAGDSGFFAQLFANTVLAATAILTLAAVIAISQLLNSVTKAQQIKIYQEHGIEPYLEAVKKEEGSAWQRFIQRWTNAVPVAKEQDVMLDHDYDGIRELDNSLPPWWTAMFYITIAFAVVYMAYYHFSGAGPSSIDEYEIQMAKGEEAKDRYLARQANKVDETNVVVMTDENDLALGKTIYNQNCVACHGMAGEGGVGPNMTDSYWLHGGDIKSLFVTIRDGVQGTNMVAWSTLLRPADIQRVGSYILTLQGTNPPNAKAPEGALYQPPTEETPADAGGEQ